MNIFVVRNGQTYGPYPEDAVRKYVSEGSMLPTDMARTEAMQTLVPLSQLLMKEAPSQPPYTPPQPVMPPQQTPPQMGMPSMTPPVMSPGLGMGSMSKQQYLDSIRSHSAYPTYRGFIGVIALLGFILAGLIALGALGAGLFSMKQSPAGGIGIIIGGLLYAAFIYVMARFFKEASLILADIGDSTVEANSRSKTGN
jgi:hypothetical protein